MTSIRTLTIALASLIAMPALAQDATTDTTSDAAGKRFAVVGGAAVLKPDRDPAPGLKIAGDVAPVISASRPFSRRGATVGERVMGVSLNE